MNSINDIASANLTRRGFVAAGLGLASALGLAACGGGSNSSTSVASSNGSTAATSTLAVAASPTPHAEILNDFAAPKLADEGITLVVKEYTDYVQPNVATTDGDVDANYFQHTNYLDEYNSENGTDLVAVAKITTSPSASTRASRRTSATSRTEPRSPFPTTPRTRAVRCSCSSRRASSRSPIPTPSRPRRRTSRTTHMVSSSRRSKPHPFLVRSMTWTLPSSTATTPSRPAST